MQLITEFNIRQKVCFMKHNMVQRGTVIAISYKMSLKPAEGKYDEETITEDVIYRVKDDTGNAYEYNELQLFPSKEALLASL
jgi:hypothetical protein